MPGRPLTAVLAAAAACSVATLVGGSQAPRATAAQGTRTAAVPLLGAVSEDSFASRAIAGRLRFSVYLPPGYATSTRSYPVVYFLHGLPATETAQHDITYLGLTLEREGLAAIVVGAQGARAGDTDPEYLDWGPGRNWGTAIAVELPRVVDARYRTVADRKGRALVGVSAGGYGAAVLGLHHLATFSAIESWSGYFHPTDPSGVHPLPLGSDLEDALANAHTFVPRLRATFVAQPTFFGFYVGDKDTTFRSENVQLARELSRAKVPFTFEIYAGGHSLALWQAEAPAWLSLAVGRLAGGAA